MPRSKLAKAPIELNCKIGHLGGKDVDRENHTEFVENSFVYLTHKDECCLV